MGEDLLNARIASIEEELKVLKAQIQERGKGRRKKIRRFSELEGLWKGKADFSFEEIKSQEIRLKEPRQ